MVGLDFDLIVVINYYGIDLMLLFRLVFIDNISSM